MTRDRCADSPRRTHVRRTLSLLAALFWVVSILACGGAGTPGAPAPAKAAASAELQAERYAVIQKAIDAGVISRIQAGPNAIVEVTPAFYRDLDGDTRHLLAQRMHAWAFAVHPDDVGKADGRTLVLMHSVRRTDVGHYANGRLNLDKLD